MKFKKIFYNFLFLTICFVLTIYYVFHGRDYQGILYYVHRAKILYWFIGALCVVLFILSESVIIYYLLVSMDEHAKLTHCFLYSFVGFFFSLVTPSATGGQPAQAIFMKKDKIPIHLSAIVLLIVAIAYKLVLVIFGFFVLLLRPPKVMSCLRPGIGWLYLGIFINVVFVGGIFGLVFSPNFLKKIAMAFFGALRRMIQSKKLDKMQFKMGKTMDGFAKASSFLQVHKKIILHALVLSILQRCFFFVIPYLVLLSFGIRKTGFWTILTLQAMISASVDMLPLPGGMGISEHLFMLFFLPVCGDVLVVPVMLVSRGLEYYTQLIISAFFTAGAYLIIFQRRRNDRVL